MILDFLNDPDQPIETGWILVIVLFLVQFARTALFNMCFTVGIMTSLRYAVYYISFFQLFDLHFILYFKTRMIEAFANEFKHFRVRGATQFLGFSKLLRLSSPNDAALGKLVTYCTGDQERIHEAIVNGVLLMGNIYNKHFFKMRRLLQKV